MNIHKSRLAALLSVMLIVCMMTAMLVVPASAAEITETFDKYKVNTKSLYSVILKQYNFPLKADTYAEMASYICDACGIADNKTSIVYVSRTNGKIFTSAIPTSQYKYAYGEEFRCTGEYFTYFDEDAEDNIFLYCVKDLNLDGIEPFGVSEFSGQYSNNNKYPGVKLASSVDQEMIRGLLNQIIDLLPIVIPVLIGFIGLNKAIKFITGVLHSA